jgi:DNA-binding HxlR family transcriptional regulator
MLTERLRDLEAEGLIIRKDFQTVPPHVEYYLSDSGKLLEPILDSLNQWGIQMHTDASPPQDIGV